MSCRRRSARIASMEFHARPRRSQGEWPASLAGPSRITKGIHMARAFGVLVLLVLAGCSGMAQGTYAAGPCTTNPGGYDCQVEMYQKAH